MERRTLFWKSIGGYLLTVKLGGKWHYVGSTGMENMAFHAFMQEHGIKLKRIQEVPAALKRLMDKKGASVNTLKHNLPFWKDFRWTEDAKKTKIAPK